MAPSPASTSPSRAARLLARTLAPFGKVTPAESGLVLLLSAQVFLLLAAYYLLKTAREPLSCWAAAPR